MRHEAPLSWRRWILVVGLEPTKRRVTEPFQRIPWRTGFARARHTRPAVGSAALVLVARGRLGPTGDDDRPPCCRRAPHAPLAISRALESRGHGGASPGQASRGIDESRCSSSSSVKAARRKNPEYRTSSPASLIDLRPRPLVSTEGAAANGEESQQHGDQRPRARANHARSPRQKGARSYCALHASEGIRTWAGLQAVRECPPLRSSDSGAISCMGQRRMVPDRGRHLGGVRGCQPTSGIFVSARKLRAVCVIVSMPMGSARSSIVKRGWWCGKASLPPAPTKKKQPGATLR